MVHTGWLRKKGGANTALRRRFFTLAASRGSDGERPDSPRFAEIRRDSPRFAEIRGLMRPTSVLYIALLTHTHVAKLELGQSRPISANLDQSRLISANLGYSGAPSSCGISPTSTLSRARRATRALRTHRTSPATQSRTYCGLSLAPRPSPTTRTPPATCPHPKPLPKPARPLTLSLSPSLSPSLPLSLAALPAGPARLRLRPPRAAPAGRRRRAIPPSRAAARGGERRGRGAARGRAAACYRPSGADLGKSRVISGHLG